MYFTKMTHFNPWDPRRLWWGMDSIMSLCQMHTAEYCKVVQTMEDHYIDWYVLAMKKASEVRPEPVRPREFRALEILPQCHTAIGNSLSEWQPGLSRRNTETRRQI
jgi:hypothetical protein